MKEAKSKHKKKYAKKISLYPMKLEDALRWALTTGPTKKKMAKKRSKKRVCYAK